MTDISARYKFKDGIFSPDFLLSRVEKDLFDDFCKILDNKGYHYLSVPSTIDDETIIRQDVVPIEVPYSLNDDSCLSGSAEQGILQYFQNRDLSEKSLEPLKLYAVNQCWRRENIEPLIRCKEFKKIEQFAFCDSALDAALIFSEFLDNSCKFLESYNIFYRTVDVTDRDPGYHIQKTDIEIFTVTWGWVESHSCTYFGEEQSKRFNITGKPFTVSNTGISSPRILLPFIEDLLEMDDNGSYRKR